MNHSADKIYSMVALRMSVFYVLQYNWVWHKWELVNSSTLKSVLFTLLRRVCISSFNLRQCRENWEANLTFKPQLQIWFKQLRCTNFSVQNVKYGTIKSYKNNIYKSIFWLNTKKIKNAKPDQNYTCRLMKNLYSKL